MSIRSEIARDTADSIGTLTQTIQSGVSAVKGIRENNRIREQNKYQLEMSYKNAMNEKAKTLPSSLDFESYSMEMEKAGQDWLSQVQSSGLYDRDTIGWLSNDFMPSQKGLNDVIVDGVTNYAMYSRSTQLASDMASVYMSDTSLSFEESVQKYKDYYNNCNLSSVPSEYGIVSPEVYAETIRSEKTVQAFRNYCSSTSTGYGYSTSFSFDKALENAKEQTGYTPDAYESRQLLNNCLTALSEVQGNISDRASEMYSNVLNAYGEYALSDKYMKTTYDTTDIYSGIYSLPYEYAGDLIRLASQIESHNADVDNNCAIELVNQGYVSDDVLDMISDDDVRFEVIENTVLDLARSAGNGSYADTSEYILNGDFGITVDTDTRKRIWDDYVTDLKQYMSNIKEMDELSMFYEQNPDARNILDGLSGNVMTSTPILSGSAVPQDDGTKVQESGSDGAKNDSTVYGYVPTSDDAESAESTDDASGKVQTALPSRDELLVSYDMTASGKDSDSTGNAPVSQKVYTDSAINTLANGTKVVNNADAVNTINQLKKQGAPQEVLNYAVRYYVDNGDIEAKDADSLCKGYSYVGNDSWSYVDGIITDLCADSGNKVTQNQRNLITERVKQGIVNAFVQSGQSWSDFEPSISKLMDVYTNESILEDAVRQAKQYAQYTRKAESANETLTVNGSKKDFYTAFLDGRYDCIIDYGILNTISSDADFKDTREYIATHLYGENGATGQYTSYDDAISDERDPLGINELAINVMMGVWGLQNDAKEFYESAVKGLNENGISASLECCVMDNRYGMIFVDSNSLEKGVALVADPDTMIRNDDGSIKANWYVIYGTPTYSDVGSVRKATGFNVDTDIDPIDLAMFTNVGMNLTTVNNVSQEDDGSLSSEWRKFRNWISGNKEKSQLEAQKESFNMAYGIAFGLTLKEQETEEKESELQSDRRLGISSHR